MRNIILSFFLIITFAAGCQNVDIKKQIQESYKKSIKIFSNDLVNYFPAELPDSSEFSTNVIKEYNLAKFCFGTSRTMLWKHYKDKKYFRLKSYYDSLANVVYLPSDTTLLLVFSYCDKLEVEGKIYENQEPPKRQKLARHNVTTATSLPVPLFEIDEYKGNTMYGLTDDFKLYVLDAQPGKYIKDKYLQECKCLPEKWKHGYSKGVALSDEKKAVIYWIAVW